MVDAFILNEERLDQKEGWCAEIGIWITLIDILKINLKGINVAYWGSNWSSCSFGFFVLYLGRHIEP